jgi:hypothetical protein
VSAVLGPLQWEGSHAVTEYLEFLRDRFDCGSKQFSESTPVFNSTWPPLSWARSLPVWSVKLPHRRAPRLLLAFHALGDVYEPGETLF